MRIAEEEVINTQTLEFKDGYSSGLINKVEEFLTIYTEQIIIYIQLII